VLDLHAAVIINFVSLVCEEVVAKLFDIDVHDSAAGKVEPDLVEFFGEVTVLNLIVAFIEHVLPQEQVDFLDVEVARVVKNLAHLVKSNFSGVLFGLGIRIEGLESALQDEGNLLYLRVEHELERLLVE